MFNMCSEVVESRRKAMGGGQETTNILNELLANDSWLEQVKGIRNVPKRFSKIIVFFSLSAIPQDARAVGRRGHLCAVKPA